MLYFETLKGGVKNKNKKTNKKRKTKRRKKS